MARRFTAWLLIAAILFVGAPPSPAAASDFAAAYPWTFGRDPNGAYWPLGAHAGTGNFTTSAEDLHMPGRLLPFSFTRTYNSADDRTGPLGPGWTHSFNWKITDNGTSVELRRGDGWRDTFTGSGGTYTNPPNVFDTLVKNGDGTFTYTLKNQIAYQFSTSGVLTRISEPSGNHIDLAYTGANLTQVTDTVGRVVALSYDGSNRIVQLQDPLGRKVTYAYDSSGRLATVTDKIGNATGQDPTAHRWQYTYDGATSHLTSITDPDGRLTVRNTYDAQGKVTQQMDGLGRVVRDLYLYLWDARMRVVTQRVFADGGGTDTLYQYTYDASGNRTVVTDPIGYSTAYAYDARGNVLTRTDPPVNGTQYVTHWTYDAKNNVTQQVDRLGAVTNRTFDTLTSVLVIESKQVTSGSFATTKYLYEDPTNPGLPTKVVAPRGNTGPSPDLTYATAMTYDSQGNLASRTDPNSARTTYAYDAVGRRTSSVDPDGNATGGVPAQHTWTTAYDENDRLVAETDPLGEIVRSGYDGTGHKTSATDANGNITTYGYNSASQLATVQQKPDPTGNPTLVYTTQITTDAYGQSTQVTQGNGVVTSYVYEPYMERLTDRYISTSRTRYNIDNKRQLTGSTAPDGTPQSLSRDALGRVVQYTVSGAIITYPYDAEGRRLSMTDSTATSNYTYDLAGRMTYTSRQGNALTFTYDLDGNTTQLAQDPGCISSLPGYCAVFITTYTFSPGGRMTQLLDSAGRTSSFTYSSSGRLVSVTLANGMTTTYTYDHAQRLTGIASQISGTTISSQTYTLDAADNRTHLSEYVRTITSGASDEFSYAYDGLSRLKSLTGAQTQSFTFDAASNIAARTGPAASYSYDGANRLTSDGRTMSWSSRDELTTRGADSFVYNAGSQLTNATLAADLVDDGDGGWIAVTRNYSYDGDGLLRGAFSYQDGCNCSFAWDPRGAPQRLTEINNLGVFRDWLVYGPNGPLYFARHDGTMRTLALDAIGSVRAEVSSQVSGYVVAAFRYFPYGAIDRSFGKTYESIRFAGEYTDRPGGLIYLRARWYDPSTGRFMTRDSAGDDPSAPATLNVFAYAHDNPTLNTDPSGRCLPFCLALLFTPEAIAAAMTIGATVSMLAARYGPAFVRLAQSVGPQAPAAAQRIEIGADRLVHVIASHTEGYPASAGNSIFAADTDLVGLVRVAQETAAVAQSSGPNLQRIVQAEQVVGTDLNGAETSMYTVVTDAHGWLVTMFPGGPIR